MTKHSTKTNTMFTKLGEYDCDGLLNIRGSTRHYLTTKQILGYTYPISNET